MPKPSKKLEFYVDTECLFSTEGKCSYYSNDQAQKEAAKERKKRWNRDCCPTVYVKTGRNKYAIFCPTRGGAFGEQLSAVSTPSPSALRVELLPLENESWAETIERAAQTACATKC